MRVGDKVKFHDYDLWEDSCGIAKRSFEQEYNYHKIVTKEAKMDLQEQETQFLELRQRARIARMKKPHNRNQEDCAAIDVYENEVKLRENE